MIGLFFFLGWYLFGLFGSLLMFWSARIRDTYGFEKPDFCPTRLSMISLTIGGLGGPPILLGGLITMLIELVDTNADVPFLKWLNTPICKSKETE